MADDDKNPFAPRGVLPDPGPANTARTIEGTGEGNPFHVAAPVLSDAEYITDRLRRAAYYRRNYSQRPHISTFNGVRYGPTLLLDAELIERYLLNGIGVLTRDEVQFVMNVLGEPESPGPLAADTPTRDRWDRAVRDAINQLRVEMVRKKA